MNTEATVEETVKNIASRILGISTRTLYRRIDEEAAAQDEE